MAENSERSSVRLLEEVEREGESRRSWWKRVLDVEEAKQQFLFSLPMILTNAFYYLIPLLSVMFAGHLGHLQLAGATLANSWAMVTGFSFVVTKLFSLSHFIFKKTYIHIYVEKHR